MSSSIIGWTNQFESLLIVGYHFLQDQYRAFQRGPGLSQLCLALKDALAFGLDLRILIVPPLASPP